MRCQLQTDLTCCRVASGLFLWRQPAKAGGGKQHTFQLYSSARASLAVSPQAVEGADQTLELAATDPKAVDVEAAYRQFPHLRGCTPLRVSSDLTQESLHSLVSAQLAVAALDEAGSVLRVTGVQMPGILDNRCAFRALQCLTQIFHNESRVFAAG